MKLKIDKEVFLQKYEVVHIMCSHESLPGIFFQEAFGDDKNGLFFMNSSADGLRFECAFKHPANVKWLMEQDWIVDYDEYIEMPLPELEALVEHLRAEYTANAKKFNNKDEAYRKQHFKRKSDEDYRTIHKISSLEKLIAARKGRIVFVFPEQYQGKTTPDTTSIISRMPGFLMRLFSHSTQ